MGTRGEEISECLHLPSPHDRVEYDLEAANASIKSFSRNIWWTAADSGFAEEPEEPPD